MLRWLRRQLPNHFAVAAGYVQLVREINSLPIDPVELCKILRRNVSFQWIEDFYSIIVEHGPVLRPGGRPFPVEAAQAAELVRGQVPITALGGIV